MIGEQEKPLQLLLSKFTHVNHHTLSCLPIIAKELEARSLEDLRWYHLPLRRNSAEAALAMLSSFKNKFDFHDTSPRKVLEG